MKSDIAGGDDDIDAGDGNDTVYGDSSYVASHDTSAGDEAVVGGDDQITGGAGDDLLYGDWKTVGGDFKIVTGGADTFIYLSTGDGGDTIGDFQAGIDKIDVSAFGAFAIYGNAPASNGIWYTNVASDTVLSFDATADGASDMQITLLGVDGGTLTFTDFITSPLVIDLTTLSAAQGFIIQGDAAGDQAGFSVSSAGDVNGDGFDDLIVGAPVATTAAPMPARPMWCSARRRASAPRSADRQVIDLTTLSAADGFIIQGDTAR